MTPTAQLIAELLDASDMRNHMPDAARSGLRRAAEALARQEELLAEAGKLLGVLGRVGDLLDDLDDGETFSIARSDGTILADDDHFRAAARLSDKLKGE